jgi:hypothetical protein
LLSGPARLRRPYRAAAHVEAATTAYWLVRAFYLFTLYYAFETLRQLYKLGSSGRDVDPLWPVFWIDQDHLALATAVLGLGLVVASVAAVAWPGRRWPRAAVALLGVLCVALMNSFGSINHSSHVWLWVAICFCALPHATPTGLTLRRNLRQSYLTVFFATQCLIALFYSLSGGFKAFHGVYVQEHAISSFAADALPLLVVQRWLETGNTPLLAGFFLDHLWIAWPAHLLVIYVELFALVAVFRPELHRLWGLALMIFHLTVWLLMGISFPYQPMLVVLLFFCSPFRPRPAPSLVQVLRQLPGFGDAWAALRPVDRGRPRPTGRQADRGPAAGSRGSPR